MMQKLILNFILISIFLISHGHATNLENLIKELGKYENKIEKLFLKTNNKLLKDSFYEVVPMVDLVKQAIENNDLDIALSTVDISIKSLNNINNLLPGRYETKLIERKKYKPYMLHGNEEFEKKLQENFTKKLIEFLNFMNVNKELNTIKSTIIVENTLKNIERGNIENKLKDNKSIKQDISKNIITALKYQDSPIKGYDLTGNRLPLSVRKYQINYSLTGKGAYPVNTSQFISSLENLGIKSFYGNKTVISTVTKITPEKILQDKIQLEKDFGKALKAFDQLDPNTFKINKEFILNKSNFNSINNQLSGATKNVSNELKASDFSIPKEFQKKTKEGENPFSIPEEFKLDN